MARLRSIGRRTCAAAVIVAACTYIHPPGLAIAVIVAVFAGHRLWHATRYPWRACRSCGGNGKDASMGAWRACGTCEGTGRRVRFTRKVLHWAGYPKRI